MGNPCSLGWKAPVQKRRVIRGGLQR